jgi:hypothetical protein
MVLIDYIGIFFLHFRILLTDDCRSTPTTHLQPHPNRPAIPLLLDIDDWNQNTI